MGHKSKFVRDAQHRLHQQQQAKAPQPQLTEQQKRLAEPVTIGMIEPHLQTLYRESKKSANGLEQCLQMYEELVLALIKSGTITQDQFDKVMFQVREEKVRKEAEERAKVEKQKEETRARSLEIRTEIIENKITFEEAAKKYSECPSKTKGGDLGWITTANVTQEFGNYAWFLEINKVSMPFWTRHGWHIVQVLGEESGRRHVRHILTGATQVSLPILPEGV